MNELILFIKGHHYGYEAESIVRLFFKGITIKTAELPMQIDAEHYLIAELDGDRIMVMSMLNGTKNVAQATITDENAERAVCMTLYHLLKKVTGKTIPWGGLTGIRPVKLFADRLRHGWSREQIVQFFTEQYDLSLDKIELCQTIAERERSIIARSDKQSFSLYISIPFCPSRCSYCSFVSHTIDREHRLIPEYLEKLVQELSVIGYIAKELQLQLKTVYFGGGTPTTLTPPQLAMLTDAVQKYFDLSHIIEYTVEAGRPETITFDKLQVLKAAGVTRISINPQTMNDTMLERIGRKHTVRDIELAYEMARKCDLNNINMDLIAGLDGDSFDGFCLSLDRVIEMQPENITVHSLTVKRASSMMESKHDVFGCYSNVVERMVEYSQRVLRNNNYDPYYLYRQKNTINNLENVGFSKPGYEGYYNVYIMEEIHTILAAGAGAVTKLLDQDTGLIKRVFNYKFPLEYIKGFDEMLARKERIKAFYEGNYQP